MTDTAVIENDSECVTVAAEYESECSECGKTIEVDTPVARMNRRWVHGDCWHKI